MDYKIKQEDGMFVVTVQKETAVKNPFWKFWAPKTRKVWVTALKKDGSRCVYDKQHKAEGYVRLVGGNLVK